MARGRMVNTTVATDRRLNALSLESHLLYMMAIPHLDRDGLIVGDASLLAARAIPRRPELHPRIEELIQEWLTCGLAVAYETDDTRVLWFQGFRKNQTLAYNKEGASQFPPPPGYHRTKDGLMEDAPLPESGPTPELVQSNAGPTPDLRRVKLSKEKITEQPGESDADLPLDPDYARVCEAYHANIGLTTKIITDKLKDDIATYSADWLVEAIGIATATEKRNLSYVEGILKRWQKEGKARQNGHGTPAPKYRYVEQADGTMRREVDA